MGDVKEEKQTLRRNEDKITTQKLASCLQSTVDLEGTSGGLSIVTNNRVLH